MVSTNELSAFIEEQGRTAGVPHCDGVAKIPSYGAPYVFFHSSNDFQKKLLRFCSMSNEHTA